MKIEQYNTYNINIVNNYEIKDSEKSTKQKNSYHNFNNLNIINDNDVDKLSSRKSHRSRNSSFIEEKIELQEKNLENYRLDEEYEKEKWGYKILENTYFISTLSIFTIYALFSDYIKNFILNQNIDIIFDILTIITFILYLFELIICSITKYKYINSFLFYLDIISTIFLLLDLSFINKYIRLNLENIILIYTAFILAARSGRLWRIVKVIKSWNHYKEKKLKKNDLNKIYPIDNNLISQNNTIKKYQTFTTKVKKIDNKQIFQFNENNINIYRNNSLNSRNSLKKFSFINKDNTNNNDNLDLIKNKFSKKSKVGAKLIDLIIQKIILLLLIMLIIVPLFITDNYTMPNFSLENDIKFIKKLINSNISTINFENYITKLRENYKNNNNEILELIVPKPYFSFRNENIKYYRSIELLNSRIDIVI